MTLEPPSHRQTWSGDLGPAFTLPARAPRGLGTPAVESLTSYLRGMATDHAVPVSWLVASFVIEPLRRDRGQRYPAVQPTRATEAVNGASVSTRRFVERVVALVDQPRVHETTLLPLGAAIECREAFRTWRAWCPQCLRADRDAAYDRLSWSIRSMRTCVDHRVRLRDRCVRCGVGHRPLARLANPWTCPHCGAPLAGTGPKIEPDPMSVTIHQLLADLARGAIPTPEQVRDRVRLARDRAGTGRHLADVLGVAASTVSVLCAGHTRPHLELWAQLGTWIRTEAPIRVRGGGRARGCDAQTARDALESALFKEPAPSLRATARACGSTPATLSRRLPSLASAVAQRRRDWLRASAALRRRRLIDEVRSSLRELGRSAHPVGRRRLEATLSQAGMLRDPNLRAVVASAQAAMLARAARQGRAPRQGGKKASAPGRASYGGQSNRAPAEYGRVADLVAR